MVIIRLNVLVVLGRYSSAEEERLLTIHSFEDKLEIEGRVVMFRSEFRKARVSLASNI